MRKNRIFWCCYILVLTIFLISAAALAIRSLELQHGSDFYEQIEEPLAAPAPPAASAVRPAVPEDREYAPAPPQPHELSQRLSHFAAGYPAAALWLQLPDTTLDYPVMLGTDNQFYLNHLPDGNQNALGSLFLDCRTAEDSVHLIVYGHNGSGGKMFGLLKQYESQDYYSAHKTLTVATSNAVYICPVFSVRRVEADSGAYQLEFEDRGSLTNYIHQAAAESLYQTGAELEDAAGVLTLSTCTGWPNQRLIVQAVIL